MCLTENLLKSAVKCLESDSKDREDFHEPGALKQSGGILITVDKVFCLGKGNDPRELARRNHQGQEKKKSYFSVDFVKQNQLQEPLECCCRTIVAPAEGPCIQLRPAVPPGSTRWC